MKKHSKTVCAFNYGPHYRLAIYSKMADELGVDFFLGDKLLTQILPLDATRISRFRGWLKNRWFKGFYWQSGFLRHFFQYQTFILTGEIKNTTSWTILLLSTIFRKRVILWTHGWYAQGGVFNRVIQRLYFRWADALLVYSNRGKQVLQSQGVDAKRIYCISNSLDYDNQLKIRHKLHQTNLFLNHFGNDLPVLSFVGRLQKVKKIELLLKAVQTLKKQNKPVNLVLIGQGDDSDSLKKQTKELGINEHVWFYGPCYKEEEIGELLYQSLLCVSPGNVGLTAIHAMMYGTPVASHNDFDTQMPEVEAIIPQETGFLFQPSDVDSLVQGIGEWLSMHNDPECRNRIRQNCFRRIDRYFNPNYQIAVLKEILGY